MMDIFRIIDILLFNSLITSFNSNISQIYGIIFYLLNFVLISIVIFILELYFGNKYIINFYLIHNFSFPLLLLSIIRSENLFELPIKSSIRIFAICISVSSIVTYFLQINRSYLVKWIKIIYLLINLILFSLFMGSDFYNIDVMNATISTIVYHFATLQYLMLIIYSEKQNFKQFGELNIFSQLISFLLLLSILKIKNMEANKDMEWKFCIYQITLITTIFLPLVLISISPLFNKKSREKNSFKCNNNKFNYFLIIVVTSIPAYYSILFSIQVCKFVMKIIMGYREIKILILYWILILSVLSLFFIFGYNPLTSDSKMKRIFIRKIFHLVLISLFIPPLLLFKTDKNNGNIQKLLEFTVVSIYGASNIFIYLEIFRKCQFIREFTEYFNNLLLPFIDKKDDVNGIIITHICLLIGASLPLFKEFLLHNDNSNFDIVSANIGFATIGVGDAFSAIFGILFGNTHLPGNQEKTVIGMIAFFISAYISLKLTSYFSLDQYSLSKLSLVCFFSSLLEAYTHHIDNATIPIYSLAIYTNIK